MCVLVFHVQVVQEHLLFRRVGRSVHAFALKKMDHKPRQKQQKPVTYSNLLEVVRKESKGPLTECLALSCILVVVQPLFERNASTTLEIAP